MSNEIETYGGGDLAPYSPGGVDLFTPSAEDSWGDVPVDYLGERQVQPSTDVAPEMQQVIREIGQVISGDLLKLGHPIQWVNATLGWYALNMGRDPGRVQRRHNFKLYRHAGDSLAESFGNHCKTIGASQEFVSNCLWLLEQMERRLTQANGVPAHAGAPAQANLAGGGRASDIIDSLDDKTFAYVERHNQNVAAQTEAYLRSKWRDSYEQNLATANAYLAQLPEADRQYFDAFEPGTWTLSLNSATTIEGLHKLSLGGALPSGSALQTEIMQIENFMRTNRKAYNRDLQIQNRLRALYERRGY